MFLRRIVSHKAKCGDDLKISNEALEYIENHYTEAVELACRLAQIPAPSFGEEERARFCCEWLHDNGVKSAYIDDIYNVIIPIGNGNGRKVVFAAHSDTVFSDKELNLVRRDGKIFCPSIGDNSANVAVLLLAAKYIFEKGISPLEKDVLLVVDVCEEGLGNLCGIRKIMEEYAAKTDEFVAFDLYSDLLVNSGVGSRRYEVKVKTKGGHSYNNFGNKNAIAVAAQIIGELYNLQFPPAGRTTCNVGRISGGTSVNAIAQSAEFSFEFRSEEEANLEIMEAELKRIAERHSDDDVVVNYSVLGLRPAGRVENQAARQLLRRSEEIIAGITGSKPRINSGSTDCNLPLSLGIPSVCVGCVMGAGAHTLEEYVIEKSLLDGLKIGFSMILYYF